MPPLTDFKLELGAHLLCTAPVNRNLTPNPEKSGFFVSDRGWHVSKIARDPSYGISSMPRLDFLNLK